MHWVFINTWLTILEIDLSEKIRKTKSFLCLGVDPHLDLIPEYLMLIMRISKITKVEKFCFSLC
jgi:hypothetical protein